ncbi:MAG: R3H domain-containing nucleic acid-binding protein [Myxococcota bacterium]
MTNPEDERLAPQATTWLEGMFKRMDINANIEADETDNNLYLNIVGPDAELFTAPGSPALNALRTVLQQVLFPNVRPWKQFSVDAAGHRERRGEQLQGFSEWLSDKASDLDKHIVVVGMNSVDRRAIHLALESDRSIKTESEGFGPFRRLKLTPN